MLATCPDFACVPVHVALGEGMVMVEDAADATDVWERMNDVIEASWGMYGVCSEAR